MNRLKNKIKNKITEINDYVKDIEKAKKKGEDRLIQNVQDNDQELIRVTESVIKDKNQHIYMFSRFVKMLEELLEE